jgi:hypothetical protein
VPDDGRVSEEVRPTGRPNARLGQTVRDMVLSLVVVLAVVGLVLVITWHPEPEAVKRVDVAPMLSVASQQAGYPVVDPTVLDGFVPTSVRWEPTVASLGVPAWHVGGVYRDDDYLQVSQSATQESDFIIDQTAGGRSIGSIDVGGRTWEQLESEERRSLVLQLDGVTTIVSSTLPWADLTAVAARLG